MLKTTRCLKDRKRPTATCCEHSSLRTEGKGSTLCYEVSDTSP